VWLKNNSAIFFTLSLGSKNCFVRELSVGQWLKMTGEENRFNNHSSKYDAENMNLKGSRHSVSIHASKHSTSQYITLTD